MSNSINEWTEKVHQGDAEEVLANMPNNSVDMAMCSPPYWGLRSYGNESEIGTEEDIDNYINSLTSTFSELQNVLKESGSFFLSISDQYQSTAPGTKNSASNLNEKTAEAQGEHYRFDSGLPSKCLMNIPEKLSEQLIKDGWILRNKIVWKKTNPLPEPSAKDRFTQSWEPIYFFTVNTHDYYFDEARSSDYDVWEVPTSSQNTEHPAPYPIELCEKAIEAACPEDGIVIDPFVGSGTTAIAAAQLHRSWIGIDLNKEYTKISQQRANKHEKQTGLDDF